jgi:histidyl-tRNA synthetase
MQHAQPDAPRMVDVYLVHQGTAAARFAFAIAENLRNDGFSVVLDCSGASFKSQMKKADGSGAKFAVIIGDDEAAAQQLTVKPLRGNGEQVRCALAQAVDLIRGQ